MKILKTTIVLFLAFFAFQKANAQVIVPCPPGHPWAGLPQCGTTFIISNNTDCYFEVYLSRTCGGCPGALGSYTWYDFPPLTTAYELNAITDQNNTSMLDPQNDIQEIVIWNMTGGCTSICLGGSTTGNNILVGTCGLDPVTLQPINVYMDYDIDGIFNPHPSGNVYEYPISITLHY